MICKNCGAPISENHRFCPECGEKITIEMGEINPNSQVSPQPTHSQTPPENYLIWAILATIFCCWPFGIPAIINASKVDSAFNRGDYAGAIEYSRNAKKWTIVSAVVGCTVVLLYIIFIVAMIMLGTLDYPL